MVLTYAHHQKEIRWHSSELNKAVQRQTHPIPRLDDMLPLNGHINRHNCVYWSNENPHAILEKDINLPGVTAWAAISCMGVIGPIFFESKYFQDS